MNDKIVRRMHAVFGHGLELIEKLDRGENPRFEAEHNKLLNLLLAGGELDYDQAYRGDLAVPGRSNSTQDISSLFLGVQYALASWLDELFLLKAPGWWANEWEKDTMEVRLYMGAQQRGWRFWNQARKAEGPRGSPEALEAFLWAVMLGFRGNPESEGVNPPVWVDNVRRRVLAARSVEFPTPGAREVPTRVPPLRGQEQLVRMLRFAVVVGAVAVFAISIAATKALSSG